MKGKILKSMMLVDLKESFTEKCLCFMCVTNSLKQEHYTFFY